MADALPGARAPLSSAVPVDSQSSPKNQSPAIGGQFYGLECTYHVGAEATPGALTADAHTLVSSALGVLLLMPLDSDAMHALSHLLGQADGLLSLAHTLCEQQQFAAQSNGGAA